MDNPADDATICAISTPLGNAGIGIIRLSGKEALRIGDRVFRSKFLTSLGHSEPYRIHYGKLIDPSNGELVDEVLVAVMRAPKSYTAEDVLEFSCHGNLRNLRRALSILIGEGAREAQPGEFTRRAFLNGRIDLIQAEAVMDAITLESEEGRRQALLNLGGRFSKWVAEFREEILALLARLEANIDFEEEGIEILPIPACGMRIADLIQKAKGLLSKARDGRIARDGFLVAISGLPNVGKSSLLNRILDQERAIVTPVAGTTRDTLEEAILLQGFKIRLVDTAGIRPTEDLAEKEGIRRSQREQSKADLVLWLVDATQGWTAEDAKEIEKLDGKNYLIVFNKSDLVAAGPEPAGGPAPDGSIRISVLTGMGVSTLEERMVQDARSLVAGESDDGAILIRGRHEESLGRACQSLQRAADAVKSGLSPELIAIDLKGAADQLGELLGISAPEELLDRIFRDFCIGK